ncbi:hypothetical protein SS05631_b63840 (plasmid) [Sinorhizobium sp. CCBAU 05631]|nr:hypothetical protein SS05631_b63840 [Sinorhizobium sp. CCBAU 05631]
MFACGRRIGARGEMVPLRLRRPGGKRAMFGLREPARSGQSPAMTIYQVEEKP